MNNLTDSDHDDFSEPGAEDAKVQEPRLWVGNGWSARVMNNDDDEGWAVAMIKDGEPEPALVGPWTMGRDKNTPKPLDGNAFRTLSKTASEVLRRHEQQLHAQWHKNVSVTTQEGMQIKVTLDIVPDDDHPYAMLTAVDEDGEQLGQVRTSAAFKLSSSSACDWIEGGYRRP